MPVSSPTTNPEKRIRLAPWRGPIQYVLLVFACVVSLALPILYGALTAGLGMYLGLLVMRQVTDLALSAEFSFNSVAPLGLSALGIITWMMSLRPLLPQDKSTRVAIQAKPGTQPRLFDLVETLCWHLKMPPPQEIWLDSTVTVRSSLRRGFIGMATGEVVLHLGMPVVAALNAREMAALLARELGYCSGGMGATFGNLVREVNAWFFRALLEREPWDVGATKAKEERGIVKKAFCWVFHVWRFVAKLPFAVFAMVARLASALALMRLSSNANQCGRNLLGPEAYEELQVRMDRLKTAWEEASKEITRGMTLNRLPENLSLLVARHFTRLQDEEVDAGVCLTSAGAKGAPIIEYLAPSAMAASEIRHFVDLSRQLTYFYYQQELKIAINEHRLVAEEEVLHQNRQEKLSLNAIKRYFTGLAHPERALCGLGGTPTESPGPDALKSEILKVRKEARHWGSQLKASLQEWNIAWQRRRDLEAAATLSMAGFAVSKLQFGTDDVSPNSLRSEAARQRMVMEHMEGALTGHEARLESRFASALGLLWWAESDDLSILLRERRHDLAGWVGIYEAMAGALPAFRELLTTFFAFQTLGAKFAGADDTGAFVAALQSVVPKMVSLVKQITSMMDGAPYPFVENGPIISLNNHLLQAPLPEMPGVSMDPRETVGMKSLAVEMATQASEVIEPFVDRFLNLYHDAFAWLAETAERSEEYFIGSSSVFMDVDPEAEQATSHLSGSDGPRIRLPSPMEVPEPQMA